MSFDKPTRNQLSHMVSAARDTLRIDITAQLQTNFRLQPDGTALSLDGLTDDQRTAAEELRQLLDHFAASIPATDKKINVRAQAHDRLVREIGFTILNRLAALRLCEERGLVIECVRQGMASAGFQMFDKLANGALGPRYEAYRAFLENLFDELAIDLGVLFDRHSPLSHVFPGERALEEVLDLLNDPALTHLWAADETIGWIYQYYNDEAERKQMRDESQAPRNSRELAVRNQFFTPRYVVEFLTDNTLGRIWYETRGGDTALKEKCRYLVIRPDETDSGQSSVVSRQKQDPRDIKMLDPAGGSGHFGLYCFDLFETIYAEAYDDPDLSSQLQSDYPDRAAFLRDVPRLILEHNLHIIDIDPRACQIAALALWLRAQRSWQAMGLKAHERPRVTRANVVCAEPMPGERDLLDEFAADLQPPELAELVRFVFDRMQLAGEAGSLLKIEEDLRAKIEELRIQIGPLFAQGDFWDNAEERVLSALRDYTEQASNGSSARRLLFADDAAQGFAFIDLCLKKYDVVLMNPPFGKSTLMSEELLTKQYVDSWKDLYAAFIERGLQLAPNGYLACISSSLFLYSKQLRQLRYAWIEKSNLLCLVELGANVLDSATVETALSITSPTPVDKAWFLDETSVEDKGAALLACVQGFPCQDLRWYKLSRFKRLYNAPFCYHMPAYELALWDTDSRVDPSVSAVVAGNVTFNDERFLRLRVEVSARQINNPWIAYEKGGEYQPFYCPTRLVYKWGTNGSEARAYQISVYGTDAQTIQSIKYWFSSGLTYSRVSSIGFGPRVMPSREIFATESISLLCHDSKDRLPLLGLLCSTWTQDLLNAFGRYRKIENRAVSNLPYGQALIDARREDLERHANKGIELVRELECLDELSSVFTWPDIVVSRQSKTLHDTLWRRAKIVDALSILYHDLDNLVSEVLFDDAEEVQPSSTNRAKLIRQFAYRDVSDTDRDSTKDLCAYSMGVCFGRWDIRVGLDPSLAPKLPDPFDPLPVCPPGMLVGPDGLPATSGRIVSEAWLRARPNVITLPRDEGGGMRDEVIPDSQYPIRIAWDGILVDDSGLDDKVEHPHTDDIVQRVREVLAVLWGKRADAIEQEACDILGVKSLRDYFRPTGAPSGFFADHLKRYSKSRRQAPIYWPLSTASGRYTVWVYYHRLTQDTLFTIVNRYVTPKIDDVQLEVDKLADKAKSASGKTKSELQTRVEDLKSFLGELTDFKTELLRIAALPYKPDLNDGVIINAAPLHKLFRLRKWATDTAAVWKKLEAGEYDWAHLAYTVWPKRVEKVCETDRSIAIAHGLEQLCKVEVTKSKGKRKKKVEEEENEDIE